MFTLQDWINERNTTRDDPPIAPVMTEAVAGQMPSVETMLMAVDSMASEPVLIGTLHGFNVFAARDLPNNVVKIVDPNTGQEMLWFSVNHQYVEGTKIQTAARNALKP